MLSNFDGKVIINPKIILNCHYVINPNFHCSSS